MVSDRSAAGLIKFDKSETEISLRVSFLASMLFLAALLTASAGAAATVGEVLKKIENLPPEIGRAHV